MGTNGASARRTGIILSYAYLLANAVIQLIYVPILLNAIGQDEYGLYQLVGSVMSYLVSISGVLSSGVGRYYCMYMAQRDDVRMENTLAIAKRMYWAVSAVAVLVTLALIPIINEAYAQSFTNEQLIECSFMMILLAINLTVSLNNAVNNAAITANEKFFFLKVLQLLVLIAQPIIVIVLLEVLPKAITVVFVVLLLNIASAVVQRIYAKSVLNIRFTYHGMDRKLVRGLLTFSVAILFTTIADQIFWKSDQLIIGYMYGAGAVAIYSIGSSIFSNFMPVGSTVASVFLPRVSELLHGRRDMGAVSSLFARVGRLSAILCFYVLGAYIVLGRLFVTIWAGAEYEEAFYIALVVMVPMLIDITQNLGITILQVMDKYLFRGIIYFTIAVLNVILTFVLLNKFGLIGAAVSTGLSMLVGNGLIMNWYYSKRIGIDLRPFWQSFLRVMFLAAVSTFLSFFVFAVMGKFFESWGLFVVTAVVYSLLYLSLIWFFCLTREERYICLQKVKVLF